MVTQLSSLITRHLKYHVCLAPSLTSHHSIFFTLFVGPISVTSAAFSFFIFSFLFSVPKLTESSEKKKKKKKNQPRKKKINNRTTNPEKKKNEKKESKSGQKLRQWVPYVCLITILPLSYELWKLKTAKSCFQFP